MATLDFYVLNCNLAVQIHKLYMYIYYTHKKITKTKIADNFNPHLSTLEIKYNIYTFNSDQLQHSTYFPLSITVIKV